MITLDDMRESSFYQWVLDDIEKCRKEAREAARKQGGIQIAAEILLEMAAKRFPDLDISADVKRIQNAEVLRQLCLKVGDARSAKAFQQRIANAAKMS